ncbi:hypothetical protein CPB83DRAFT_864307 [Crepidotus variabilis]|uniref:Uncharacterized protein n=1 Tax=Crepidotus variabilis TaxID=179855 RepID=A0A9P6E4V6_9AGAR|nr:hypothetical protein CPB83DRAFT_864307 [Crepidotus variabilis]
MKLELFRNLLTLAIIVTGTSIVAHPLPVPPPPGPQGKAPSKVGGVEKVTAKPVTHLPTIPKSSLKKSSDSYIPPEFRNLNNPKRPGPIFKEPADTAMKNSAKLLDQKKQGAEERAKGIYKAPKKGSTDPIAIPGSKP